MPTVFGFLSGERGPRASRTMMLAEIRDLFDAVPTDAPKAVYRGAIMDDNVLGKGTLATRRESYERLGWLCELDPAVMRDVMVGSDGKLPCTLLAFDEIQQYIADEPDRSRQVYELAEAMAKHLDGRVLLVGTGQSALHDTPLLQKIAGRFPTRLHLSDTDAETVTRAMTLPNSARNSVSFSRLPRRQGPDRSRETAIVSPPSGPISSALTQVKAALINVTYHLN